jgi:hypothetical protein
MASPEELVERRGLDGLEDITRQMEYFPPLPYQPGGKLPDMQKAKERQIKRGWR